MRFWNLDRAAEILSWLLLLSITVGVSSLESFAPQGANAAMVIGLVASMAVDSGSDNGDGENGTTVPLLPTYGSQAGEPARDMQQDYQAENIPGGEAICNRRGSLDAPAGERMIEAWA